MMGGCATAAMLADPAVDMDRAAAKRKDTAVFAGGGFGASKRFSRSLRVWSRCAAGFAGGDAASAHYET